MAHAASPLGQEDRLGGVEHEGVQLTAGLRGLAGLQRQQLRAYAGKALGLAQRAVGMPPAAEHIGMQLNMQLLPVDVAFLKKKKD